MKEYQSLSHTRWDCKYHVVSIPKRRKKRVFGVLRRQLGEIFHELASHKESTIMEGHMTGDHVRMCLEPCAEIRGLERGWLSEGEERDPDCAQVRRPPGQFHRRALLGEGYVV